MNDPFDDQLAAAGRAFSEDRKVASALTALADARASAALRARKRRVLIPSISIGVAFAVSGAGAVVATQWKPWEMTDPDIVVARDWSDGSGTYLGSCETRLGAGALSAEAYAVARDFLDSLDVDSIDPNPEIVAGELLSVGRPDDLSRLIPGAVPSDFDVTHTGELWSSETFSDARILQDGLMHEVFTRMAKDVYGRVPVLDATGISYQMETQCTTDPSPSAGK